MDEESGSEGGSSEEKKAEQKNGVQDKPKKAARKRKNRKKQPAGLRRQIRTKFDTVEDLNPEARLAQTDEIERIRRLELQQSLTTLETVAFEPSPYDRMPDRSVHSSSPSSTSLENTVPLVVIQSDTETSSDSTDDEEPNRQPAVGSPLAQTAPLLPTPPPPPAPPPSAASTAVEKSIEAVQRKYDLLGRREDGRVLVNVGHPSNEPDIFLAPQIGRIVQQHQVSVCVGGGKGRGAGMVTARRRGGGGWWDHIQWQGGLTPSEWGWVGVRVGGQHHTCPYTHYLQSIS